MEQRMANAVAHPFPRYCRVTPFQDYKAPIMRLVQLRYNDNQQTYSRRNGEGGEGEKRKKWKSKRKNSIIVDTDSEADQHPHQQPPSGSLSNRLGLRRILIWFGDTEAA